MTAYMTSNTEAATGGPVGLTLRKTLMLAAYAALVWFCAAMFIRFAGPKGAFDGVRGIVLFVLTVPGTIPINSRARRIARLPLRRTVSAIAVTSATATLLDGLAMTQFPDLYGPDRVNMGNGAIWLLWAIGVALTLALVTSSRKS